MFGRTIMGLAVAGTVTLGGCVSPGLESCLRAIEQRQGQKISCLEEIAFHQGWIDRKTVENAVQKLGKSSYGLYLNKFVNELVHL